MTCQMELLKKSSSAAHITSCSPILESEYVTLGTLADWIETMSNLCVDR